MNEPDIDPNLIQTFLEESEENLALAEKYLLDMESAEGDFDQDAISAVFRAIHSFKGGSSFFNLTNLVNLLHVVENLLSNLQNCVFEPTSEMFQAVLESLDVAKQMLYADDYGESVDITSSVSKITQINAGALNKNKGLHLFDEEDDDAAAPAPAPAKAASPAPAAKKTGAPPKAGATKPAQARAERKTQSSSTVRVKTELIDNILDQVGEVILVRNQLAKKYPDEDIVSALSQRISKLHNTILETRMQSVSILFEKFHRVVRDLSMQLEKNIQLNIDAGDVELDRTILESFSDPMTHLVRNAADHGLESSEERVESGKTPQGNLWLSASQKGGQVEIVVEDDGKGINVERVKNSAIEKGLITEGQAEDMSDAAIVNLIMMPGFSTREVASELSGRGVGMDVVKSSVEEAGGSLKISTVEGRGSKFISSFPLTLAIATALIVKVRGQRFGIPEILVEEIASIRWRDKEEVLKLSDDKLYFKHRGELIPAVILADALEIPENLDSDDDVLMFRSVVLCRHNGQPFSIIVDKILNIEDIAVKGMPLLITSCEIFFGLTVLENGEVSMLIDVPKLGDKVLSSSAMGLSDEEAEKQQLGTKGESRKEQVIVFTNSDHEYFGIHIDFLSEIVTVKTKDIEKVGDSEYFKLHGKHVPLIRIDEYLPVAKPHDRGHVLVFVSSTDFPVGIIGTKAIKVRHVGDNELNANLADTNGILSTIIDDDHMVTILDTFTLYRRRAPDHFKIHKNRGKGRRILLVEDTSFFIILISQYLKETGFEVDVVHDGSQALERLNREGYNVCLLLSDIVMPVMDGFELVERVRRSSNQELKKLPVIAITGISEEAHLQKIKEAGFNDCILKNEKDLLIEGILNQLDGEHSEDALDIKMAS